MLRLNPNPVFRTLSACGPPSGEMAGEVEGQGERSRVGGGGGDPLSRDPPL